MLTGTDIIDHMRMIRLKSKDENLILQEEYANVFDGSLDSMLKNAQEKKGE